MKEATRKLALMFVIATFLTMLAIQPAWSIAPANTTPLIWREKVGTVTDTYYVPVFVLYDPPGAASYSKFQTETSVGSGFRYNGLFGVAVSGQHTTTWAHTSWFYTPNNDQIHKVLCLKHLQTWDIWYFITPSHSYYKLYLKSSSYVGYAVKNLDSLDDTTWITDRTGTTGAHQESREYDAPVNAGESFEYVWDSWHAFGGGITITWSFLEFTVSNQIMSTNTKKITAEYNYIDSNNNLDFDINSDNDWYGDEPFDLDGINIWFSE